MMNRHPDLLLTIVLLVPVLALGAAVCVRRPFFSRKTGFSTRRRRWTDAELKRRFPGVHERLRGGVNF